jgi:hypothetical protein
MTTFGDMVNMLGGVPVGSGLDVSGLAGGNWFFCDPTHGNTNGDALTPGTATNSLLKAYNKTRDGYNDGVIFIGGATAWNPTAMLTWSNNYTHLIGTNSMPGLGNRCRIVSQAAAALTVPVTFSGAGCYIKNIQISNEKAAGAAAGCAIITGLRNVFEDVFFMSPVATDAASYSCKLGSAENAFIRCTFLSWGYNADHVHVLFDVDMVAVPIVTWFEDCLFDHVGTALTESVNDNCTAADHQILYLGQCDFMNVTAVGGTLTYMFVHNQVTTPSGLLMTVVAES